MRKRFNCLVAVARVLTFASSAWGQGIGPDGADYRPSLPGVRAVPAYERITYTA